MSDSLSSTEASAALSAMLRVLRGTRNGLLYGVKVRAPHALVFSVLFGHGSVATRLKGVLQATSTHSIRLAKFVLLYKAILNVCGTVVAPSVTSEMCPSTSSPFRAPGFDPRQKSEAKQQRLPGCAFIAGGIAGYLVFGRTIHNHISQQIVLFLMSRVLVGFAHAMAQEGYFGKWEKLGNSYGWPLVASLTWASVMALYEYDHTVLNRSLSNSMTYLYKDSDWWQSWHDFIPFPIGVFGFGSSKARKD